MVNTSSTKNIVKITQWQCFELTHTDALKIYHENVYTEIDFNTDTKYFSHVCVCVCKSIEEAITVNRIIGHEGIVVCRSRTFILRE